MRREEVEDLHLLVQVSCPPCHFLCAPLCFSIPRNPLISQSLTFLLTFLFYVPFRCFCHISHRYPLCCLCSPPICTEQTGSGNLANPCWDSITLRQVCRHNPPFLLVSSTLYHYFLFKSNTIVLSALHGSLPTGVCTTSPRSALLFTIFFIGI